MARRIIMNWFLDQNLAQWAIEARKLVTLGDAGSVSSPEDRLGE